MYRLNRTSRFFVCTITIVIMVLFAVLVGTNLLPLNKRIAHAATNNYLNFQARILTSNGGVVPDGMYNVEFKLYNQDSGGSALWTETWTGSNRIRTVNGYISANLGSVNSFSSNINWDQELWITLNIGGTGASPSWDGEMNPRMKVTGVPYAIAAGKLQVTNGSYTSTLSLTAPTGGNQTFVLPNLASATSATVITTGNLNSINAVGTVASGTWNGSAITVGYGGTGISSYVTGDILYASDTTTLSRLAAGSNGYCLMSQGAGSAPVWAACAGGGAGAYIQNQFSAQQASSNFWISGTGRADTSFITTLLDTPTATALNVGTTNATQINLNKNVVVKGNTSDSSSTALTVTNSSDTALLTIRNDGLASFSGNVSVSGTYNSNTFTSSQLTFGAASATTVQSANNQNLTVRSQGSGTLTLGNGSSQFTLQGNQSSIITASNGSYTATVSFTNPVANVTYRFPALAEGTYDICTLGGNCLGNGDIIQGGNAYNATIVVGATDNYGLNLITNNTTRLSVTNTGNIAMDTDTLYVDAVNHRVGIGNTSPSSLFSVGSSSQLRVDGSGNILTSGTYNTNTFTSSSLIFGANSDSTIQAASNQGLTVRSQGTGTLTLGATAQQTTLQGSASSSIVIGNGTYTTTVDFANPTANVVYRFPALGAGTYDICTSGNNCTGLGAYIQNQFSAQQAGSNFWISGTGRADTSFTTPLLTGINATSGSNGNGGNITISAGARDGSGTTGSVIVKPQTGNDSTTAFQVQNAAGTATVLNVDTTNQRIGVGTTSPTAKLDISGAGETTEGSLDSELVTNGTFTGNANGWTLNSGWSYSSNRIVHTPGSTDTATQSLSLSAGSYQVKYTVASRNAGTIRADLESRQGVTLSQNVTDFTEIITVYGNGSIAFVPSSDFDGAIDNVSVRRLNSSSALQVIRNSDNSIGLEVRSGGSGFYNTFLGVNAGSSTLHGSGYEGYYNTAIGYNALRFNTTGYSNTVLGYGSLQSNTTGYNNVAIGVQALINNTVGSSNVAIGESALMGNITGSGNVAIGAGALRSNITGGGNIAIGDGSLLSNTTGGGNIAIGQWALLGNTTGSSNIAIGWQAMKDNTTGTFNYAFGHQAAMSLTTGSGNVAFGIYAMGSNSTGESNASFGVDSMRYLASGSYNVGVGREALTGSFNGSNNTALGAYAGFGYTPNSVANTSVSAGGSVNVGTHYYKVTFVINGRETNPYTSWQSTSATTTTGNQTVNLSDIPTYSGPLAGGTIARRVYRTKLNDSNEYYLVGTINNNTTITYTDTLSDASLGSAYVGPSHSIMLGTSAKAMFSNQLVVGDGEWDNHISESYWGGGIFAANPQNFGFYGTSGSGTNVTGASLIFGAGRGTGSAAGGDIIFQTAAAGSSGSNINNLSEVMRITNTGRVSVGNIASPTAYLQVAASTTSTASLRLTSSAGTNPSSPNSGDLWWNGTALNFYNGSSTINLLNNASGSFINNQNAAQQASSNFWISGTGRADTSFLSPLFLGSNAANGTITIQGNSAASGNTADSPNIQFKVGNSGTTTAMTIVNNGGVVIGNPGSSAARLTIGGDGTRPGYIEGLSIINSTAQGREYFIGVQSNHNGGRLEIHDTWADSLRLVLDADGRFGIGGLYPQFDLHVGGAGIGMAETSFLSPAFDSPTASSALNIGTSNTNAITIGNAARNSSITLNSGTGTIAIGTGNQARTINIGTGTAAQTITVGSTNGASSLLLQSGTGALNIQTQGTGGINIGTNAVAQTVTIGNTTGASAVNLQAGSGNINLNSVTNMQVTSANAFRIQSASAADTMFTVNTSGNQVKIGNDTGTGSATTLLVLDSASSAPTGTAGAMYYNTTTGRIQCYENGSWGACGRTTLQEAYTFSAGAAPSIALNSTNRAFVLQNSATGTISGELFGVRANAVNDTTLGASLFSITSAGRLGINIGSNVQNPTVNYDLAFGQGVNRTIGVEASSGTTGYNLTVSAGNANGSGTAYAGGQISIQGGNAAGTGNAAGGNVYLTGGSGVGTGTKGLVIIDTPTFTTSARQDCASNCTITQANVDGTGAVIINATAEGLTISLPDPTNTTAGRIVYVTAYGSSNDFSLSVNGGGVGNLIAMRANTTATMVWNGSDWTAAGASSSTTLQAAYDNTLSSAGGAEIVLNNTATSNGLTVRNNASNPIIGDGLFEVQTSIGSNLFSVNNNAVEYASNGGAETQGASASTFPANTWSAAPAGGTVSRYTTQGDYIATGAASVSVTANAANRGAANRLSSALTPNLKYTVSYAVRGAVSFSTLDTIYSRDGTNTSTVSCATDGTVTTGVWTRISCTFTAPASGITASNAIFIRQSDATSRTFYIDNLSVTVSADVNHAADGSVDDSGSFTTNWTAFGASTTVARDTSVIYDTSGSARVDTPAATNRGIRNNLSITPQSNTQYLVSLYARSTVAMTGTDFTIRYSRDGGTNFVDCTDYNTRAIGTAGWTKVTCLFTTDGTAATNPDLIITQATSSTARSIYIDALTITLNTNTASNVQIGGGNNGGPVTLFTLDRSAGAPIAANNDTYLGSMYYDTVTGKIQCYEADGWGACGSAPDNIVNLNPEFSGAVLNGSGVGTMTADFCGNGGGLSVNTALCASGEARNFYRWNSPQATQQTYSIYVTYQLPASFKAFADDNTVQLTARRDSTNAAVTYEMYRSEGGSIYACGTETTVTTQDNVWQTVGINGNESTGCGFTTSSANAFVIFKINVKAQSNANAFVGTLTFTTTGR